MDAAVKVIKKKAHKIRQARRELDVRRGGEDWLDKLKQDVDRATLQGFEEAWATVDPKIAAELQASSRKPKSY